MQNKKNTNLINQKMVIVLTIYILNLAKLGLASLTPHLSLPLQSSCFVDKRTRRGWGVREMIILIQRRS